MEYVEFKQKMKSIGLTGTGFAKIFGIGRTTMTVGWNKNGVPTWAVRSLELLEKMPIEDRGGFIYSKTVGE
jgi:hypothetical protein